MENHIGFMITLATVLLLLTSGAKATVYEFDDLRNFGGVNCNDTQTGNAKDSCDDLAAHTGDDAFKPSGNWVDKGYKQLPNDDEVHTWKHIITFDPPLVDASDIIEAELSLTHRGNAGNKVEAWFAVVNPGGGEDKTFLGTLGASNGVWLTQVFSLADVLADIADGEIRFQVKDGQTYDESGLKLASSYVDGTYEVPEPMTLGLLGLGLLGLGRMRRSR